MPVPQKMLYCHNIFNFFFPGIRCLFFQKKEIVEAEQNGDVHPAELEDDDPGKTVETDAQDENAEEEEPAEEDEESVTDRQNSCLILIPAQTSSLFPQQLILFFSFNLIICFIY